MSEQYYKNKSLKDVIEGMQLFSSYPKCILNEHGHYDKYHGKDGAIRAIHDAMAILQSIGRGEMEDFYDYVDKDDLFSVAMFLTEKSCSFDDETKDKDE